MASRRLVTAGATVAAVAGSLCFATAAQAAPASGTWPTDAPSIQRVGGELVSYDDYAGQVGVVDAKPQFQVRADAAQKDGRLIVTDTETHKEICSAGPSDADNSFIYPYSCTPTEALAYGLTTVSAVIQSPDGSEASETSREVEVYVTPPEPTAEIAERDAATGAVTITGRSVPGATVSAYSAEGSWTVETAPDGTFTAEHDNVKPGQRVTVTAEVNGQSASTSLYVPDLETPAKPTVGTPSVDNGSIRVELGTTQNHTEVALLDSTGRFVTGTYFAEAGSHRFVFPDPKREATYTAVIKRDGLTSEPVEFTVNVGKGQAKPDRPTVEKSTVAQGRAVVDVEAGAGNTVSVLDEKGAVVAAKRVGANGTVQVSFPAPAQRAAETFTVRQSNGTALSADVEFQLGDSAR